MDAVVAFLIEIERRAWSTTVRRGAIVVGRGRDCDLRIDGAGLAARHALVELRDGQLAVAPIDGVVRVDDRAITRRTPITDASAIELGTATLRARTDTWWREREPYRHAFAVHDAIAWPPALWRERLAADAHEHGLLAQLREDPGDAETRMVYADWLEQRGELARAEVVRFAGWPARYEVVRDSTAEWRRIAAAAPISNCHREACPTFWHELHATDDERRRVCASCALHVRYIEPRDPGRERVRSDDPVVLDLDVAMRFVEPARIDQAIRRAVPPEWTVSTGYHVGGNKLPVSWTVTLPGGDILEHIYGVLLDGRALGVLYGGTDAGPFDPHQRPTYSIAELDIRGIDDDALVEWLRAAFAALPSRTIGFS